MKYLQAITPVIKQYGLLTAVQLVVRECKHLVWNQSLRGSFSQHYEDLILDRIFQGQKSGLYLDIGCHEPKRINNTYRLYQRGWTGVCVDAAGDYADDYKVLRPRDIFVQVGIGRQKNSSMNFFEFSAPALSTFSKEHALLYQRQGHALVRTIRVPIITLTELCDTYIRERTIDLLCLDIEGYDFEALESLNWQKYTPRAICVERKPSGDVHAGTTTIDKDEIDIFLKNKGYKLYAHTSVNSIYIVF
ncbi:MAG: FkbM family methyltransferase [Candidatus Roizmanbacteria bacterium]